MGRSALTSQVQQSYLHAALMSPSSSQVHKPRKARGRSSSRTRGNLGSHSGNVGQQASNRAVDDLLERHGLPNDIRAQVRSLPDAQLRQIVQCIETASNTNNLDFDQRDRKRSLVGMWIGQARKQLEHETSSEVDDFIKKHNIS